VLLTFAAAIGFAFVWALVLHEKPPDDDRATLTTTTTVNPLVPATLPAPRRYKVTETVNVRQGPATNTTILTKLETGTTILVECRVEGQDVTSSAGTTNLWLRTTIEGAFGYVSALYVDTGDDIENPRRIAPCL
jgi:uncharacterized protein YraI